MQPRKPLQGQLEDFFVVLLLFIHVINSLSKEVSQVARTEPSRGLCYTNNLLPSNTKSPLSAETD